MADTSNTWNKKPREMYYYRQRFKNRVFNRLASFFAHEAENHGITKKVIAERLNKDPAQITRWLSGPANLTLDTLSDLLFAMEAEPQPPCMMRWVDMPKPNYVDPLIAGDCVADVVSDGRMVAGRNDERRDDLVGGLADVAQPRYRQ